MRSVRVQCTAVNVELGGGKDGLIVFIATTSRHMTLMIITRSEPGAKRMSDDGGSMRSTTKSSTWIEWRITIEKVICREFVIESEKGGPKLAYGMSDVWNSLGLVCSGFPSRCYWGGHQQRRSLLSAGPQYILTYTYTRRETILGRSRAPKISYDQATSPPQHQPGWKKVQ